MNYVLFPFILVLTFINCLLLLNLHFPDIINDEKSTDSRYARDH